jgi:hypothetical protein
VCPTGNIVSEEDGRVRKIWGREFELQRCAKTGVALPITKDQAEYLAKQKNLNADYFATSAYANRVITAMTLGRIARWNGLGMQMEVK